MVPNDDGEMAMTQRSIARSSAVGFAGLALFIAAPVQAATFTEFDVPGSDFTAPMSINSAGVITGSYGVGTQDASGFVRAADGTITSFDPKGSAVTVPYAIDDAGRICGTYTQKNRMHEHAFVREPDGSITVFDPPHATQSWAVGFDGQGNIVGSFSDHRISQNVA